MPERRPAAPGASAGIPPVSGLILAGGRSSRFGGPLPKQLVEIEGEPLVRRVARRALGSRLAEVVVVLGHYQDGVRAALAGLDVRFADDHALPGSSVSMAIRTGIATAVPETEAAIIIPVDLPYLSSELLDRLVDTFRATRAPLVAPTFRGQRSAPILFARSLFPELLALRGEVGGKVLLERHPEAVVELPLDSAWLVADLDTPKDFHRLGYRGTWRGRIWEAWQSASAAALSLVRRRRGAPRS